MNRKLFIPLFLLVLMLFPLTVSAVPAYPAKKTITLQDGAKIVVTLRGDEFLHYYESADGRFFSMLSDNQFREISSSEMLSLRERVAVDVQNTNARRSVRRVGTSVPNLEGTKRGLVILINFNDNNFTIENPREYYDKMFNQKGFSENGMHGSVTDYFNEQSYGKLDLQFDVVGPYKLSKAMGAYGGSAGEAHDANPQGMVAEAVKLADPDVNYGNYDWDKDGYVDQVFLIYAGYGESYGASPNTIWPHESSIAQYYLRLDGKYLATYGCSCELRDTEKDPVRPDGIGAPCHEFSHCMGLPDMYDTKYNGNYGTGYWDLMNQGCYLGESCTPCGYTAYERMFCGWLQPTELSKETQINDMKSLVDSPEAYILYNDGNRNEYYLLENRQKKGFDSALFGHGLLITHVTYDAAAWENNLVNSRGVQGCVVVPADNNFTLSETGIANDLYPGGRNVTALTNRTTPAATLNNPNSDGTLFLNKAVEFITEKNGMISFLACRPDLGIPQMTADILSASSIRLQWPAVDTATKYEIEVNEYPSKSSAEGALVLQESFKGCYSKSNGFTDISSKMSTYCDNSGFGGSKLFQGKEGLLCGTSTAKGKLQSPVFRAPETGSLTLVLKVVPFTAGTPVEGNVTVTTAAGTFASFAFAFSEAGYLTFRTNGNLTGNYYIDIEPTSRMFFTGFALYDGNFSDAELDITSMNGDSASKASAPRRVKTSVLKVTGANHTFTDLTPTSRYEFRIRSANEERTSLWSDYLVIDLGNSTAIEKVEDDASPVVDAVIYDMNGRRVSRPSRGLYIRDGKKYFLR